MSCNYMYDNDNDSNDSNDSNSKSITIPNLTKITHTEKTHIHIIIMLESFISTHHEVNQ